MTTAVDTTGLRGRVAQRDQRGDGETIADFIERQKPQLQRALPAAMSADRFARIVLNEVRRTPNLLRCSPESLLGALMHAAQLGLEPGPLGQAYLVPYNRQVTFILGYRGMIDLALRGGQVKSIVAREVCDNDDFDIELGTHERLTHKPCLKGDRGAAYAYYGVAEIANGAVAHHVMRRDEVDRIRARSKAKNEGPWDTDYDAMARKTVIRQMAKFLPLSVKVAEAIENDEAIHEWRPNDTDQPIATRRVEDAIDIDAQDVPDGSDSPRPSGTEGPGEADDREAAAPDAGSIQAESASGDLSSPVPALDSDDITERAVALARHWRAQTGGVATAKKRALTGLLKKLGIPDDLSTLDPDQARAIVELLEADG